MVSEEEFSRLIGSIVARCMPDEQSAYDLAGGRLISDAFAGGDLLAKKRTRAGEFGFIDEATAAMEFILLIQATYNYKRRTMLFAS